MGAFVLVLVVDLHVPASRSLKEKRAVVKSLLEGARRRFAVAAAETDHQDTWQRAGLAFACVASSEAGAVDVIDAVERHVWSLPGVEVLSARRCWLEDEG